MLKLSKREKLLINLLILICIISGAGLLYYLMIDRIIDLNNSINLLKQQIQQITLTMPDESDLKVKKDLLRMGIDELEDRYYQKNEMDPYTFGILIKDLITSKGLDISKYQTIEAKDSIQLEFSVSGNALDFSEFLESVSLSDKYWSIPYLTMNANDRNGRIQSVFRITYGMIDEKNN